MSDVWSDLHKDYANRDWAKKPSLFAQTAITYFPKTGSVLELGAGLGQDSNYFAEHGYDVTSTDLEQVNDKMVVVDLREELPFETSSYDVIYAHLSLHYFDSEITTRLFGEIMRVLKPDGVFAFFANSVHDPEFGTGTELEPDFFQIGSVSKRYFSLSTTRLITKYFDTLLLDDHGETYKDRAKGVHNLIRFVGTKPDKLEYPLAIPFVGAIIERQQDGETELLMQTRWKPHADPVYSGTLEFPAGTLDEPYQNVYDTLKREIREECGLILKAIKSDSQTTACSPLGNDSVFGFRPFCCTQQLKNGKPWIGFVFVCEVEVGVLNSQLSEAKDAKWMKVSEVRQLYEKSPEKLFGLEIPAWEYYFREN